MADEIVINVRATDSFSGVLGNFGNILTGIKSAVDLAGDALRFFADKAMAGLDAIATWERLSATMETLIAREKLMSGEALNMAHALSMSGDEAEGLLIWIQELAIKSPFTAEGVANAFRTAQAYGFTADEAQRLTQAMIDFAAGSGASEGVMNQIALALGQIQAKGKLAGQEVLQLVNAGLPVTQILADAFNVTTSEIVKMQQEGLLPAQKVIEAITVYLETNFAGAAERQANTWAGLKGTFQDIAQMGLREFFGGLFDALQPVAVALSEFLQTEGMDRLREWGGYLGIFTQAIVDLMSGNKLYDLGAALQGLAGTDSIFYALGTSLRIFQQAIDEGATSRDAFLQAMQKFTDLSGIEFNRAELDALVARLDVQLAEAIEAHDWEATGRAFSSGIAKIFSFRQDTEDNTLKENIFRILAPSVYYVEQFFQSETGQAIKDAVSGFFSGAFEGIDNWFQLTEARIDAWWAGLGDSFSQAGENIGQAIIDGFNAGINYLTDNAFMQWIIDHIIRPAYEVLGIASPSTVFMEIGRNIVLGLIQGILQLFSGLPAIMGMLAGNVVAGLISGWATAFDSFLTAVETGVNAILSLFEPVLDLFNIDLNLGGGGSVGSGPGDTTHPRDGGTGGTVTNIYNFYGTVYMSNVGPEGTYDCEYPNPIISGTTGGRLVTSGLG